MSPMASQITGVSIVYSTVCSGADQRKHQSSASLALVRGIHQSPVNSPHKGPVTRKMFPFDDVIMVLVHVRSLYGHSESKHDIPYSYSKTLSFMWKYAVALAICIDNMIGWTDGETGMGILWSSIQEMQGTKAFESWQWHGNDFFITDTFLGESTGHSWIPLQNGQQCWIVMLIARKSWWKNISQVKTTKCKINCDVLSITPCIFRILK